MNKGLIGEHYWVINGFPCEPPIEDQITIAKEEIAEYENKQQVAKDTWTDEEWKDEAKLYEFWLYKNMVFYWERVLKTLQEGELKLEEVELPEPTEVCEYSI